MVEKDACIPVEEMGDLIGLPEEDPRMRHLESCPRCRSLFAAYQRFLEVSAPDGFREEEIRDAEERLAARIGREIRREGELRSKASPDHPRRRGPGVLRSRLLRTIATAAAVIVLLVFTGRLFEGERVEDEKPVLRGVPGEEERRRETEITLLQAEPLADGTVRLRWTPFPEADSYRVLLYSSDLEELPFPGPVTDTLLLLRPEETVPLLGAGTILFWRVAAFLGGDRIALSPVGTLQLP